MSDLTEDQIEEYREVFDCFDKDGNGEIDVEELRYIFEKLHVEIDDEQLGSLIQQVDTDQNGIIDFDEFLILMQLGQDLESEDDMISAFKEFDLNGAGLKL